MKIAILDTSADIGAYVADMIENRITSGRMKVLGVATGSSPLPSTGNWPSAARTACQVCPLSHSMNTWALALTTQRATTQSLTAK
ncbi:hypothetical protein [Pseudarthrobacter sp. Y6]|uniref:hypothetical protein n=1 Tax=Pseudarthrobacter sp. Y6 TaxID=3418422 RepID=UPI003CEA390A